VLSASQANGSSSPTPASPLTALIPINPFKILPRLFALCGSLFSVHCVSEEF
jgi:hypothetical protein